MKTMWVLFFITLLALILAVFGVAIIGSIWGMMVFIWSVSGA